MDGWMDQNLNKSIIDNIDVADPANPDIKLYMLINFMKMQKIPLNFSYINWLQCLFINHLNQTGKH